jgi:hypothetical protein
MASVDLMNKYTPTLPLESQVKALKVDEALRLMKFSEFKFNKSLPERGVGVGIRNLLLFNSLRMTLYYLPEGETMKLHDHPGMSVINFMLQGKM